MTNKEPKNRFDLLIKIATSCFHSTNAMLNIAAENFDLTPEEMNFIQSEIVVILKNVKHYPAK